jgi:site-specific recombinase XerC
MVEADGASFHEEQTAAEEERRIYQVTDGLKSLDTIRTYRHAFKHFIKITVRNDNLQALIDTKSSVIESKIISHIEYLKVKELKYWSIQVYCAAILHFFEMNDVVLNAKKIKRFLPADEGHYQGDRPYSTNEIELLLSRCDIRSRLIILLMTSTGMRIGALPGLRLSDIKRMDEFGLYLVYVYIQSKKDRYYTFTTPECTKAIDDYLEFRKRCGEILIVLECLCCSGIRIMKVGVEKMLCHGASTNFAQTISACTLTALGPGLKYSTSHSVGFKPPVCWRRVDYLVRFRQIILLLLQLRQKDTLQLTYDSVQKAPKLIR